MVILGIAFFLSFLLALLQPYASRLQATGLWLGKAIVPPEAAGLYPRGLQDAITDGTISNITFAIGVLPYPVCAVAFFYSWWAPILVFAFYIVAIAIAGRSKIASKEVDYYLNVLLTEIGKRRIKYEMAGDTERAEIITELSEQVTNVLAIYFNTGVPAPTPSDAKNAPFGDEFYLLEKSLNAS